MEFIIAIWLLATVIFLVKDNSGHSNSKTNWRNNSHSTKTSSTSSPDKNLSLRDLLPKGFLEKSGDKILDFSKPTEEKLIEDYSKIYALEESLLTPAELKYMKVLQEVVSNRYYILSKVRVADVFKVKKQRFAMLNTNGLIKLRRSILTMFFAVQIPSSQ